jgi:lipopolysaccharide transport system ATP-binding protein
MSDIVIKVENISKQYRLGDVGTGALAHDVNKWWHKLRGKENPYLKIGDINDRTLKSESNYVWALKDINFEVEKGEVLGIIGRNGAGKSTLLKILSKTTTPTTGCIKLKGRIASLLEVGTGFHPELSGRENIFLNGAILGLTRKEIEKKFDEIVDFAGVERYIDTPVKRYSSGMYVRLAFGVAAHLEPEILIVDEVLAVGDAEFQKKCIGKMKDVSDKDGRTVIVVSHNISSISAICTKGLLMKNGELAMHGDIDKIITEYENDFNETRLLIQKDAGILQFKLLNSDVYTVNEISDDIEINFLIENLTDTTRNVKIDLAIFNETDQMIIHSRSDFINEEYNLKNNFSNTFSYKIVKPNLSPGKYFLTLYVYSKDEEFLWIDKIPVFGIKATKGIMMLNSIKSFIVPDFSLTNLK